MPDEKNEKKVHVHDPMQHVGQFIDTVFPKNRGFLLIVADPVEKKESAVQLKTVSNIQSHDLAMKLADEWVSQNRLRQRQLLAKAAADMQVNPEDVQPEEPEDNNIVKFERDVPK